MKRLLSGVLVALLAAFWLTACSGTTQSITSAQATAEDPMVLRLAHSLNDKHPTSQALESFAEDVAERSNGRIKIEIYSNGQLGSEDAVLGQLRQGIVDMVRVSAPSLSDIEPAYHAFGLPYLFHSEEQFYDVMGSPQMSEFFRSTEDEGFVGLTYYTSGARSFYTAHTPVRTPADLQGLKIRVQDMRSQTEMLQALGGAPVVMNLGDTYTSLQTGLIDGAESNPTVLTESAHGEVTHYFSMTEHTRIPDMLVISTDAWHRLSPTDQQLVSDAARQSTEEHKQAWAQAVDDAVQVAKEEMGVEFITDVDVNAFKKATRPVVERYAREYPDVAKLLDLIEEVKKGQ